MSHVLGIDFLCRITKKNTGNVRINVTLRSVRVTTFAVEKQVLHILSCSLSYSACNAHALYYIVHCGLSGSTIFFHTVSQTTCVCNTDSHHHIHQRSILKLFPRYRIMRFPCHCMVTSTLYGIV
jgi:hypothetical protein